MHRLATIYATDRRQRDGHNTVQHKRDLPLARLANKNKRKLHDLSSFIFVWFSKDVQPSI